MNVNVQLAGSLNNINNVSESDIEVYFEMPEEPGTYDLPLFVEIKDNPFVSAELERSNVHITTVEANQ
jgi:hypothetical protein